ncbi:uncharacterized protein LOC143230145 isoform X1 [Tachypleus tridentatus]|uniref:uncharacterized protein LOC143230145 isoform X1 n=1 Tax=Tachypleus tridentatus TaxID=6853 RepID=UPI003FD24B4C
MLSETVSLNLEIKSNPSCSRETVMKDRVRDKETCQNLREVGFGVNNSNKPSHQAKFHNNITNTVTNDKLTIFASRAEQLCTISVKNVQLPSMVNQVIPVSEGCFSKEGNDKKKDTARVHLTSSKSQETSVQDLKSGSFLNIPNSNKSECQKSLQQANTNDNHQKTSTYNHQHNETMVNENQHQEVQEEELIGEGSYQEAQEEELIGEGSYQEERQNENQQQELPVQVYSPNYQQQIGNSGELLSLVSSQNSSLIRQVMLPDEQVDELNNNEPEVREIGEHQVLPGNVIIVQNPDGTTTLQIPSDQAIPLETLQALLAMDQNLSEFLGGNLKQQEQQSS